jgi:hypothetical protein
MTSEYSETSMMRLQRMRARSTKNKRKKIRKS